ncbi:InlB B-repeat-containing protein, partial [Methanoculleus sp.]|uniref:InlB B-repeat-containing protein n=1 Tax=Methanoculleus sp. TaxID=90427 RepID=UPI0025CD764E
RHIAFYNEFIEVTYETTLDHNRLNEFNGINQEYRAFEIPRGNQAYKRHDFYGDYVLITGPNVSFEEDVTVIKNTLTIPLLFERLIDVETDPTKITSAFVWTDGFSEVYPDDVGEYFALLTPVVSHGGKGGLVFTFGFDNNQVAGDALYEDGGNIYNQPIRYTNEQGFFTELWFGMINQYAPTDAFTDLVLDEDDFNDGHAYPLVKDSSGDFGQSFIMSLGDSRENYGTPILYDTLQVYKDSSESYKLSYQISILPYDYKEFVIGQYFYTDNRLVRNKGDSDSKLYLYRYKDGTYYNKFDDLLVKITDGSIENTDYDIVELVGNTNIFYSSMTLYFDSNATISSASGHTSWAIVDEDGNLYLACNKPYNIIYIHSRHFRPNVSLLGNKSYPDSAKILRSYSTSSYTFGSTITLGETTSVSLSNGINYYILANGIKNIAIYGSALIDYTMNSTINVGDDTNIGTISNGINYYILANVKKYFTITGSASIDYIFDASETVGTSDTISNLSSEISYYVLANYSISATSFTVTFKDWNGTTLKSQTTTYGGSVTPPTNPTRTGYTFTGWDDNSYTYVESNLTITAQYTANTYTVYFNENGGGAVADKTVTFGNTYGTLPTPIQNDWVFLGWYTSSTYATQVTSATTVTTANNHTLYAQWVSYDWVSGGTSPTTDTTCNDANDDGNVQCDYGVIGCSWNPVGLSYTSSTDISENVESSCYDTATKTVCTLYKEEGYGWVSGGTTPTVEQDCLNSGDIDNIRCDTICVYTDIDIYLSPTDDTDLNTCSIGGTQTICEKPDGALFFTCVVQEGEIGYTNCETCSIITPAEYTCTDYEAEQEYGYVNCETCEVTYK